MGYQKCGMAGCAVDTMDCLTTFANTALALTISVVKVASLLVAPGASSVLAVLEGIIHFSELI